MCPQNASTGHRPPPRCTCSPPRPKGARRARAAGLARAPFARRFRDQVGEPPVTYVTRWRMTVAADRLTAGESIAATARAVGYDNEFAFAKAFKRVCGEPPGEFRRNARVRSVGPVPGAGA